MTEPPPVLAAVDWGTTRFRLWLLARDGRVLAQSQGPEGLEAGRTDGFETVLRTHLAAVSAPASLPVLICGMAGSREGWVEAPYVDVPAPLERIAKAVVAAPDTDLDVRVVPGLAKRNGDRPDVLRGEETQLIGVAAGLPPGRARICLPGTHSKWVTLHDRRVEDFTTYLTGDLYAVLSGHSILRHSVAGFDGAVDADDPAFTEALHDALAAPDQFTAELFSIRAAGLLHGLAGAAAAARLSGLLIGVEVAAALRDAPDSETVTLVATAGIARLYTAALAAAGATVTAVDADRAVCAGLLAIAFQENNDRLSRKRA